MSGMTVTELIGSSLLRVAYSESRGNSELAVRMAMHARGRERSGELQELLGGEPRAGLLLLALAEGVGITVGHFGKELRACADVSGEVNARVLAAYEMHRLGKRGRARRHPRIAQLK